MNIIELFKKFPTEESCIEWLERVRWDGNPHCLYCGSTKVYRHHAEGRHRLQCGDCHKSFSVTMDTIFHNTKLDLRKWFWVISMMLNAKKGISSYQVARELDLRRPTAWSMMHRIRKAMSTEQKDLLTGIFEMDETYVNARKEDEDDNDKTFRGGRSTKSNTPIVAIKKKGGDIKAFATNDTKYHTLGKIAMDFAKVGSEIHTDEYASYSTFKTFYNHKTVNHGQEYVNSDGIHCNSIEGFWSLLKRGIKGNFHWISRKYLQNYVDEFEYRYNHRENKSIFECLLKNAVYSKSRFEVFC